VLWIRIRIDFAPGIHERFESIADPKYWRWFIQKVFVYSLSPIRVTVFFRLMCLHRNSSSLLIPFLGARRALGAKAQLPI
jgi:hypothetical protein